MKTSSEILTHLRSLANPTNVAGMARYAISTDGTLGISIYTLRDIAREVTRAVKEPAERHALAAELWASAIHEARILASIVDDPTLVDEAQMEAWVVKFDSWDVVDQVCDNLFAQSPLGYAKAVAWSRRPEEFVCRSGFTLMACLAAHDKSLSDAAFEPFYAAILDRAGDERNFVKKAVNWALRNIGKRSLTLNARALEVARQVQALPYRSARWIAHDAIRELESEKVQARVKKIQPQRTQRSAKEEKKEKGEKGNTE